MKEIKFYVIYSKWKTEKNHSYWINKNLLTFLEILLTSNTKVSKYIKQAFDIVENKVYNNTAYGKNK